MGKIAEREENLLYPIFAKDISDKAGEVEFLPVFASEIADEQEQTKKSPEHHRDDRVGGNTDFISKMVNAYLDRLRSEQISVDEGVEEIVAKQFQNALIRGEIREGADNEEYINDRVLETRFHLMVNGPDGENRVTAEVINTLMQEGADEIPAQEPVIREENPGKTEAPVPKQENKISGTFSGIPDAKKGYVSVWDALNATGKYPTKKDEQKNKIADMEFVEKINTVAANDSCILCAYYNYVCYAKNDKIRKNKNDIMKLPFLDNTMHIIAITDKNILICDDYERKTITIPRENIVSVHSVFEKKLGSLGQIQIELNDGYYIVITIDRDYASKQSENEQYENLVKLISQSLQENTSCKEDSVTVEQYRKELLAERSQKEKLLEQIMSSDNSGEFECSAEDKQIVMWYLNYRILECNKKLNSFDEQWRGGRVIWIFVGQIVNERVNALLGRNVFKTLDDMTEVSPKDMQIAKDKQIVEQLKQNFDKLENKVRTNFRNGYGKIGGTETAE